MKIVLISASLLAVLHHAFALVCPTTPVYTQKLKKMCVGDDTKVLWPDYTDVTRYYRCQGAENPILDSCFPNTVFNFYEQKCARCDKYVPAPECEKVSTIKNNCEKFTPAAIVPPETIDPFCNLPVYKTTFRPKCVGNDVTISWPNYDSLTEYYYCKGLYNPQIKKCAKGTYFNFYAQSCTDCETYVAAPVCEKLPFDKTNKCVPIGTLPKLSPPAPQTSTCLDLMNFSKKFTPTCAGSDADVLWPNYENFKQYYLCLGVGNPQLEDCPYNSYFSFPLQRCTRCNDFIPPPECSLLPTKSGKPTCTTITPTKVPADPLPPLCPSAYETYYATKYEPTCVGKDVYTLWPNYENLQKYYMCKAEYKAVIKSCPSNTYFNYYAQECTPCDKFLAAPPCEKLKPQNTPKCVKI